MTLIFDTAKIIFDNGQYYLALKISSPAAAGALIDDMQGKKYQAKIKPYRQKRSLDANAYFWLLCGKLAAKINTPRAIIYRQYIREIGDNYEIVPIREDVVDTWIKNWESRGLGWVCDIVGQSKIDGYINVICYYGSSTYDTAQMSRLIDMVVQDCEEQGIETMTPAELARLKEDWK
jgi:hypothetical protein